MVNSIFLEIQLGLATVAQVLFHYRQHFGKSRWSLLSPKR